MSFGKQDIGAVVDYVLASEERVSQALTVIHAGDAIRRQIIRSFLVKLQGRLLNDLTRALPGRRWKVEIPTTDLFEAYWALDITKPEWKGLYGVELSPEQRQARALVLAVHNEFKVLKEPIDDGTIKDAVDKGYRPGRQSKWCPYWEWAEEFKDWDGEAVLWELHSGTRALEFFSDRLVRIVQAGEPAIDKAAGLHSGSATAEHDQTEA